MRKGKESDMGAFEMIQLGWIQVGKLILKKGERQGGIEATNTNFRGRKCLNASLFLLFLFISHTSLLPFLSPKN